MVTIKFTDPSKEEFMRQAIPMSHRVCPWDAIEMIPTEQLAPVVAQVGGPPAWIAANWDKLVGVAQHLAELKAGG